MPVARTPEQIRSELDAERAELADAVEQLRGKLKPRLPVVAGAVASVGFVLAGGVGATVRYVARRGRSTRNRD